MSKLQGFEMSTWTTGAGIAIGTNVDIAGYFMGAAATTLTLKVGTATLLVASAALFAEFPPVAVTGALNGTSSGGSFAVIFRKRPV